MYVNKINIYSLEVFIFLFGIFNGEIRSYIFEVFNKNILFGVNNVYLVFGLDFFIEYLLCVYICIDGGCVSGFVVMWSIFEGVFVEFSVFCLI